MSTDFLPVGDPLADLSPARRRGDEKALTTTVFDVIVIGGGITGAGIALDAATRGLSVLLLEAQDLAFGTSRWSSKLVHGGLRYLANGQVDVAWESAVERGHLMTSIAPHLVRALAQVVPVMDDTGLGSAALTRAGFAAGDALRALSRTSRHVLPGAKVISPAKTQRLLPAIAVTRLRGGLLAWDGLLEDDARLVVCVARTAAAYGARILTGYRVLSADGTGVRVVNESDEQFDVRARNVISATGVWAESFDPQVVITPSRGTHVVLRSETLKRPRAAMTVPVPEMHGRYCFVLPRPDGLLLAGITDIDEPGPIPQVPSTPVADIDWILAQVSRVLETPISAVDAVGAFTGLRPLVAPPEAPGSETADISRRHLVRRGDNGVITVTGGKLTTYRRMAQDAVDLICDQPCRTTKIALVGAGPPAPASATPARLIRRYGAEAARVAALADEHPELLEPLAPGIGVRGVELVFAVRCEGARTLADVLERRTRLSLVPTDLAAVLPRAEEILDAFI